MKVFYVALMMVGLAAAMRPAWAVNKCTGKDGAVAYQDAPCDGAAAAQQTVKTWANTPGESAGRPNLPVPTAIEWLGSPDADHARADALLDAMRTQGRDCEWALKVTRGLSITQKCVPFMAALQEGGNFQQVNHRLQTLMANSQWAASALPALKRTNKLMEEVVRQKEIMMAHLATP